MSGSQLRPRILLVTHVSAFSSASGMEQRSTLMRTALSACGEVDVLELKPGKATKVSREVQGDVNHVLAITAQGSKRLSRYAPDPALTSRIEQALGRKLSEYKLIVGHQVWGLCQLQIPVGVKVIADLNDFRYRYAADAPWSFDSLKERLLKFAAYHLMCRQLHRFSGAFVLSGQDRNELSQVRDLPTAFLPNVAFSAEPTPVPLPANKQVLFVGSLWYRPNVEGVNWFLEYVWPAVLAKVPDARLMLAGAAPPHVRAAWEMHTQVAAPGFVKDLAATYRCAQLVVVPLHTGGGTNIKVLEALAYARPCLATGFVVNAFDDHLVKDRDLLVADDPSAFIEQTINALQPNSDLQAIATAGYHSVHTHFGVAMFNERVVEFANSLLHMQSTAP